MLWAVIMAGGIGTRFWPESRIKKPKQFLKLYSRKTLFEETIERVYPAIQKSQVLVVTNKPLLAQAAKLGKIKRSHVIGEPVGRNTAPCAVLAAACAYKKDPDAVLALLPADHRIGKPSLFRKSLLNAYQIAAKEKMPVTFGIRPTRPHTGYGYLELDGVYAKHKGLDVYRLKSFCEKPSLSVAKRFLESGNFLWNSGMFVWHAGALLEAANRYLPDVYDFAEEIVGGRNFRAQMDKVFPRMRNISIDYGLMEKLKGRILTIPLELDWNDLGSWQSCSELWPKDGDGNLTNGKALFVRSVNNTVKSEKKLVALLGVKDLVVIDTEDALLICSKDSTESVRDVVKKLRDQKAVKYL